MIPEYEKESIVSMIKNVVPVDEEVTPFLQDYGIYHKTSKTKGSYFCTGCMRWYDFESKYIKHKSKHYCLTCVKDITMLSEGLGRGNIQPKTHFIRYKKISDTQLVAAMYTVRQRFDENKVYGSYDPVEHGTLSFEVALLGGYYFEPGRAVKLLKKPVSTWGWPQELWQWTWAESNPDRPPNFTFGMFRYGDNDYYSISEDEILQTSFRYAWETIRDNFGNNQIMFLSLMAQHPNAEYLCKAGYERIVYDRVMGYGMKELRINWKTNNLKKMLGLSSEEIIKLNGSDAKRVSNYKNLKKIFPKAKCEDILKGVDLGSTAMMYIREKTGASLNVILDYIQGTRSRLDDWKDYIRECVELEYDLTDTAVQRPKDLYAAHQRTSMIIADLQNREGDQKIKNNLLRYKDLLYFESGNLKIVVPEKISDIVSEGKTLSHCVGGYANRYADGALYIVFLRKKEEPEIPYYTIEVNLRGQIVQCRGYKNNTADNPKTEDIIQFEKEYQTFLDEKFKNKKKRKRKSA